MHSNFIQLAVDTGILGLASWISIWVAYFLTLYRKTNALSKNDPDYVVCTGSMATSIGFLVGGIFEVNLYDSEVSMLLYFIMALPFCRSSGSIKSAS